MTTNNRDVMAIDKIAIMLGTRAEWSGADMLESIANIIGTVRPHPGDSADTYLDDFAAVRGFDPATIGWLRGYISDEAIEARNSAEDDYYEEDDLPVAVVDEESATRPGDRVTVIARFATVEEAERYIGSLPDIDKVERGGYGIDAPEDD